MRQLVTDLRYTARLLRRSPGTVSLCVLSLGLGIGATTAVFSFVNAVQFAALPVRDEARLVDVSETSTTELCAGCSVGTSYPAFLDWQARASSFEALEAYREDRFVVSGGAGPERVGGAIVSAGLFRTLGAQPVLGRDFAPSDDRLGAPPVVVLSDTLWRRRFAGNGGILGEAIKVNGVDRAVIGVMPPRFAFPEYAQLWLPLAPEAGGWARTDRSLGVVGRLRAGATIGTAGAEMRSIADALAAHYAEHQRWSATVVSLREDMTSETATASLVLLSAVGFVLLIACANVANLLLVRANDRRRELAIRAALGAGSLRIARLVLTESLALSIAGGVLGLLLAVWASGAIVTALGADAPYWIQFGIDGRVFAFGIAITLATGALCGVAPSAQAARSELTHALKDGGAISGAPGGRRLRSVLAAGQLALALLLLAGAGLMVKTTIRTFQFDVGYDASRVLVGDVSLTSARYDDPAQILAFSAGVIENLERIPGVRAAVSRTVFFRGFGRNPQQVAVEGRDTMPDASPGFYHAVTPGYFAALGLPLRPGRDFLAGESDAVIVNREMARRIWSGESALGQRIRFGDAASGSRWLTVVGIVDARGGSPMAGRSDQPSAYVPLAGAPGANLAIVVGADRDPSPLAADVRASVAALDPDQPVEDLMTMVQAFRRWAAPARFIALLMGSLAGVALLMAAMGTFGVVAAAVSQRTREIGVRLALGATPRQVQHLVVQSGVRLAAAGLAFGLPAAWASTRLLRGILVGTSPTDPLVFGIVSAVLAIVTLIAAWIPARRAARVDPLVVLRIE